MTVRYTDYTYDLYLGIDGVITWSSTPTGYDQSQVYLSKDGSEEPAYGYQLYHNLYGKQQSCV